MWINDEGGVEPVKHPPFLFTNSFIIDMQTQRKCATL